MNYEDILNEPNALSHKLSTFLNLEINLDYHLTKKHEEFILGDKLYNEFKKYKDEIFKES